MVYKIYYFLGMTLNCSSVRLDNQKGFCTQSPWTKFFERLFFLSFNKQYNFFFINFSHISFLNNFCKTLSFLYLDVQKLLLL